MHHPGECKMRRYLTAILFIIALTFSSLVYGEDEAYELGCKMYDVGDYEAAYETWSPAAVAGDADSQFGMGQLYANGYGVPLDDAQALDWYSKAAEQGHGDAQCQLGVMHANGWGVPMDEAEAMKWYKLAAENGVTEAMINVGTMYQNGFSVEQDKIEALKWFTIAAKLGDQNATAKRDYLAERLADDQLIAADSAVTEWFTEHETVLSNR